MIKFDFYFILIRILIDLSAIYLGLMIAYFLRMYWYQAIGLVPPVDYPLIEFFVVALKITMFLWLIFIAKVMYSIKNEQKLVDEFLDIIIAISFGMSFLLVILFFMEIKFFSRFIFLASWGFSLFFVLCGRAILRIIRMLLASNGFGQKKILILGTGKLAEDTILYLKKYRQYKILGILTDSSSDFIKNKKIYEIPILDTFDNLEKTLDKFHPHEILLANEKASTEIMSNFIRISHRYKTKFRFFPDALSLDLAVVEVSTLNEIPLLTLKQTKMNDWSFFYKSFFDICIATFLLLILSPLLLWIVYKVKKEDPKTSVIYKSKRVGRHNKIFYCYKFRTMIQNADQQKNNLLQKNERAGGVLFKIKNDPRVTSFGKFLRKSSLDELPQLFNVLKGQMSLIGPRAHLEEEVQKYPQDYLKILSINPGLSGFSQINGRSNLSFEQEMQYELFYMKNWSLWLDGLIFLKSIWVVFSQKNVS